jgi:hypothetical protein
MVCATTRLGGAFHSRRLQIISSQVGHVAPAQRATISHRQRLQKAIGLLDDPRLDTLVRDDIAFDDAPARLTQIFNATSGACPLLRYQNA